MLKATRNKALHSIRNIQEKENKDQLNVVHDEINNSKNDSRRMFQAVKAINRNNDNVTVKDQNGNYIGNTKGKIEQGHPTDLFLKISVLMESPAG